MRKSEYDPDIGWEPNNQCDCIVERFNLINGLTIHGFDWNFDSFFSKTCHTVIMEP